MDTKLLSLALMVITLTGCQYPMGLSKTEWQALPPEQQAEYRRQQAVIDEQHRKEQAAIAAQQRAEAAERARQEQLRLATLYTHARYGDIVTVTIEGGLIDFGKHRPYQPVRFDILRGERKQVEIFQQGDARVKTVVPVRLSDDGQTFYFDEYARDRISLINAGNTWQAGKKYESQTIRDPSSKSIASAITIHLQYKDMGRGNAPKPVPNRPKPDKPLTR